MHILQKVIHEGKHVNGDMLGGHELIKQFYEHGLKFCEKTYENGQVRWNDSGCAPKPSRTCKPSAIFLPRWM